MSEDLKKKRRHKNNKCFPPDLNENLAWVNTKERNGRKNDMIHKFWHPDHGYIYLVRSRAGLAVDDMGAYYDAHGNFIRHNSWRKVSPNSSHAHWFARLTPVCD
jgi:hypothetical protein